VLTSLARFSPARICTTFPTIRPPYGPADSCRHPSQRCANDATKTAKTNVDRRIEINTATTNRIRRVAGGTVLAAATALIGLGFPAAGHADPGPGPNMGCETIHWGLFGNDRRQICDGPQQPDGTWQRTRTIFTPASNQPLSCRPLGYTVVDGRIVGDGSGTCSGGVPVPQTTRAQESYVVAPNTVLPDEPGWLPPYTNNIL
jgi:hypothetical protein